MQKRSQIEQLSPYCRPAVTELRRATGDMGVKDALRVLVTTTILALLPGVLSGNWTVQHPAGPICTVRGSTVVIPCHYGYPDPGDRYRVRSVMWCLSQVRCITPRYVYHSEGIFLEPAYLGRVEYLGDRTNNCTLKIADLRVSDSGTYVFRFITDHPVEKLPAQTGVTLAVSDSSNQVFVMISPSGEVVEGIAVTLTCCSTAKPPVEKYSWLKIGGSARYVGPSLTIRNISIFNGGQYYCVAQNELGPLNSTAISVNVQYPPKSTSVSVSASGEIVEGSSVNLTCSSNANPPVERYTWLKKNDTGVWQTGSGQSLNFSNFRSWNSGQYYCEAGNKHGAHNSSAVTIITKVEDRRALLWTVAGITVACVLLAVIVWMRKKRGIPRERERERGADTQSMREERI
ncbi:hypothetical protein AAFF_G00205050 [Aldrovandia affinis]|uniref:B-cell receptor CD22 n=1 Tax=Aldrovandia affinis TaxID=143900 RepID=A0AAD7RHU2_9TELE|nr:hypothetical protein AAFF_G00205050 [Aldrovandia affinis]